MSEVNSSESSHNAAPTGHAEFSGASLENALAGNFQWRIGDVLNDGLDKLSGFKRSWWGATLMYYGITFVLAAVLGVVVSVLPGEALTSILSQVILVAVTLPMMVGIMILGIRRAADLPVRATMIFDYYSKTVPIVLLYLAMTVVIMLGFILLVLPGIYLAVAYMLALPLLVEKNLGIWEAMEASRKAITKCWFRFFGLMLLMMVIVMISAIPLGIGLIWTLPLLSIALGAVYRDVFGVTEQSSEVQ